MLEVVNLNDYTDLNSAVGVCGAQTDNIVTDVSGMHELEAESKGDEEAESNCDEEVVKMTVAITNAGFACAQC